MADEIGSLKFIVEVDKDGAVKGLKQFDKSTQNSEKTVQQSEKKIGSAFSGISLKAASMATAVGASAVKLVKAIAQVVNTIEEGRQTIVYATGASGNALEGLMNVAKDVYTQVDGSFNDVSRAIGEINTRLGLVDKELEETTVRFMNFAKVTGQDVQSAVRDVTQVMNQWNVSAEEMPLLLDKLTVAGQQSGIAVNQLASDLILNTGTFKSLGYTLDETVSLLMSFEKQGVNSSAVVMGMKKAFGDSAKAGIDARTYWEALLASIGDSTDKTKANTLAVETFGDRVATTMVTALQDGKISVDDFTGSLKEAEGALDSTITTGETTVERIKKLKKELENSLADLGETTTPLKEEFLDISNQAVKAFDKIISALIKSGKAFEEWRKKNRDFRDSVFNIIKTEEDLDESLEKNINKLEDVSDLTAESARKEQLLMHAKKEKTEATKEDTEATEESAEAIKEEGGQAEGTANKIKILTTEEERLAKTRETNAQKYKDVLKQSKQALESYKLSELEASDDIEGAYQMRRKACYEAYEEEKSNLEDLIKNNEATKEDLVNLEQAYTNEMALINQQYYKALDEQSKASAEQTKQYWQDVYSTIKDGLVSLGNAIAQYYSQSASNLEQNLTRIQDARDADIEEYQKYTDNKLEMLRQANEQGAISDEEYTARKQEAENQMQEYTKQRTEADYQAEEDLKKEINELNRRAFIAQKANSIATTLINGAEAIVKGYAQLGPVAGSIAAGVIAALTAVQVATISSQQFIPSYSIGAREITEDQTAQLHAGETVLRKTEAERFRDLGGLYGLEKALTAPLTAGAGGVNNVNVNSNLSAVIEVDGVQLGIAVLKNIDNASQFVMR